MTKDELKAQRKADNALYRAVITQMIILMANKNNKADRQLAAADACQQVAERLRERATASS